MKKPNLIICGDVDVVEERDPDCKCKIDTFEYAVVIQFPDKESIREALKTGKIECNIFGESPD